MANSRMNVLVYSGLGTTISSVEHCLLSLRQLLSPRYAVIPISEEVIKTQPWSISCALICFPGGKHLEYCKALNGPGNSRVQDYVEKGGRYLGICAGAYYGSKQCEWDVDHPERSIIGPRELSFFPGICRGPVFSGFVYDSEFGVKAVRLNNGKNFISREASPDIFHCYFNGGGVFIGAIDFQDRGVEILARYFDPLEIDLETKENAAIVYCKVGEGSAILSGPNLEFDASLTGIRGQLRQYDDVGANLANEKVARFAILKACLDKLGLKVDQEQATIPSLSLLHLSSAKPSNVASLLEYFKDIIVVEFGQKVIKEENDTFILYDSSNAPPTPNPENQKVTEGPPDYDKQLKHLVLYSESYPPISSTPYFDHNAFYTHLTRYQSQAATAKTYGQHLLYGEVVTSTTTLLEKNPRLLRLLPSGFVALASQQLHGRGRGSNTWVSPTGSLAFSTLVRHRMGSTPYDPLGFGQYLAAIAVIEGIKSYAEGYGNVDVRIKWPNDIYAKDSAKIGGILVNSTWANNDTDYIQVIGIGLNVSNAHPTTSLNSLLDSASSSSSSRNHHDEKPTRLPDFDLPQLLARILTTFEDVYATFLQDGFTRPSPKVELAERNDTRTSSEQPATDPNGKSLEERYYSHWLHTNQLVTLIDPDASDGHGEENAVAKKKEIKARIVGVTSDLGCLIAEEEDEEEEVVKEQAGDNVEGRREQTKKRRYLEPDGNSFDFWNGLISRKA